MIEPKSDVETVHADCDESVSEVSVLVVAFQTSFASDPIEVSVLVLYAQIVAGNDVIAEASDVEAVVMLAAVDAVPAVIAAAIDDDAELVFALIAV